MALQLQDNFLLSQNAVQGELQFIPPGSEVNTPQYFPTIAPVTGPQFIQQFPVEVPWVSPLEFVPPPNEYQLVPMPYESVSDLNVYAAEFIPKSLTSRGPDWAELSIDNQPDLSTDVSQQEYSAESSNPIKIPSDLPENVSEFLQPVTQNLDQPRQDYYNKQGKRYSSDKFRYNQRYRNYDSKHTQGVGYRNKYQDNSQYSRERYNKSDNTREFYHDKTDYQTKELHQDRYNQESTQDNTESDNQPGKSSEIRRNKNDNHLEDNQYKSPRHSFVFRNKSYQSNKSKEDSFERNRRDRKSDRFSRKSENESDDHNYNYSRRSIDRTQNNTYNFKEKRDKSAKNAEINVEEVEKENIRTRDKSWQRKNNKTGPSNKDTEKKLFYETHKETNYRSRERIPNKTDFKEVSSNNKDVKLQNETKHTKQLENLKLHSRIDVKDDKLQNETLNKQTENVKTNPRRWEVKTTTTEESENIGTTESTGFNVNKFHETQKAKRRSDLWSDKQKPKFRDLKQERNNNSKHSTRYSLSYEEKYRRRSSLEVTNVEELFDESYTETDDECKEFLIQIRNNTNLEQIRLTEEEKDLFDVPKHYSLAHCVAEDMRMGSGVAVNFKNEFKNVEHLLTQHQTAGGLAIIKDKERYIYYLVTKQRSRDKPTYTDFWCSMKKLRDHIKINKVKYLAIPKLGCGLDKLNWPTVKNIIEFLFKEISIEILYCKFTFNEDSIKKSNYTVWVTNYDENLETILDKSIILYFSTVDNHISKEMLDLDKKFNFLNEFKLAAKTIGSVIQYETGDFLLCGCIVKDTQSDQFDFIGFKKCIDVINIILKETDYSDISLSSFCEDTDKLLHHKIITMLIHYLTDIEIHVYNGDNHNSIDET